MNDFEDKKSGTPENFSSDNESTASGQNPVKEDVHETPDSSYHFGSEELNSRQDSGYVPPENTSYTPPAGNYPPGGAGYNPGSVPPTENGGYVPPENGYNNSYGAPPPRYPYAGGYNTAPPRTGYAYNPTPPTPPEKSSKKKMSGGKIFGIVAGVLIAVLVVSLIIVIAAGTSDKDESITESSTVGENIDAFETQASPESGNGETSDGMLTPKGIYNKVLKSSVGILVYDKNKALASEGTGVLFQESKDGKYTYIVTCAHVIAGSSKIMVQLYDSSKHEASVVGFDTRTDIGVLKIEANGLQLADIGDSSKISVGDPVYAIGNPGGVEFANSFTNGMVSALDRPVNSSSSGYTMECIQHTAAINPGNSGGALVNASGQVIGINSMKIVANEYEGMGFSVPSSVFVGIVNNIMENGYVSNRPKLGITYVAASEISKYGMFVAIKELPSGSIVIHDIAPDSALAGTEAKPGDLITAVNGKDLDKTDYLPELIENSSVGDKLTLSLIRIHDDYSFEELEVTATLVEDRGDTITPQTAPEEGSSQLPEDFFEDFFKEYFGGGFPTP